MHYPEGKIKSSDEEHCAGRVPHVRPRSCEETLEVLLRNTVLTMDLGCPVPPDFLLSPLGRTSFMRLSLMKAAHAVTDKATHRKSGYLAGFWRDVGFHGAPSDSLRHTEFFNDPN
jgi:hypothetical protein